MVPKYQQCDNLDNFTKIAMSAYKNIHCKTEETFKKDLERFSLIGKIFYRYKTKGQINIHLLINHFVILFNSFDNRACIELLFIKIKSDYWPQLKTILTFFEIMPDFIHSINANNSDLPIDSDLANLLRSL